MKEELTSGEAHKPLTTIFSSFFKNLAFLIKVSRDKNQQLTCCGKASRCQATPSLYHFGKKTRAPLVPAPQVSRKQAASPVSSPCAQVATHFHTPLQINMKRDSYGKAPDTLVSGRKAKSCSKISTCDPCKPSRAPLLLVPP